jgi:sugar/nucleoside kinase (ribokinase family)
MPTIGRYTLSPDIVCLGQVTIDSVSQDLTQHQAVPGGSALYPAVFASKLGARVGLVCIVGRDFPQEYLRSLERLGLDTDGVHIAEGVTTRLSLTYAGENLARLEIIPGVSEQLTLEHIPSKYLFTEIAYFGSPPKDFLNKAIQLRWGERTKFALSPKEDFPSPFEDAETSFAYSHMNWIFFNERELLIAAKTNDVMEGIRKVTELGPKSIVVTLGSRGSLILAEEKLHRIKAYPISNPKAFVGAGDAYVGALLYCSSLGVPAKVAGEIASLVAAEAIQALGPEPFKPLSDALVRTISSRLMPWKGAKSPEAPRD